MTQSLPNSRVAYGIHAVLSALVLGLMAWATIASLRLETAAQAKAQERAEHDHERSVQLAVYQMENLASAMLSREMLRSAADYAPLYFPGTDEIRVRTGEMLPLGFLVRPSPLLLQPPENPWIRLHFQASPLAGYRSPQIIPEQARHWTDFDDDYDAALREQYKDTLAHLRFAYTVDELARKYEEAGGSLVASFESDNPAALETAGMRSPAQQQQIARSEYIRRKQTADLMNQPDANQQLDCTPAQLAVAQLHTPTMLPDDAFANELTLGDEEVGISYRTMLPAWLSMANRKAPDLAFLRAAHVAGETAFQGFLIDWPRCKTRLLAEVADRFPRADLEIIDPPPAPDDATADETVLGVIPARFVPHAQPVPVASGKVGAWSTTHTFLLIGWVGSVLLLLIGALGIRSLISLTERRTQFAYAVTHELRTPLTTFRLYTDMLAQGLVAESDRQSYLDTLNQESQRLADLVSGVLEYSRVENHSVPIHRESATVGEILDLVRSQCTPRCAAAGMRLEVDAGDIADAVLETDRQHLVQIIGNLVDNACKYGRNEHDPVVRVRAHRGNGALQFDVADHGNGIPPRLRSTIFEPYQRGDADTAPAVGGIGLGLALSRSWAKLLGGNLELMQNGAGEPGARFRVTLPLS